jgi:hypothetical protein
MPSGVAGAPASSAECRHTQQRGMFPMLTVRWVQLRISLCCATGHGKRTIGGSHLCGAAQSDSAPHAMGAQSPSSLLQHSSSGTGQHAPNDD